MRILLAFPVLLALVVAEPARADDHAPVLDTLEKRLSYAVGVSIGNQLLGDAVENGLDPALVAAALSAVMNGEEPAMTQDDIAQTFQEQQAKEQAEVLAAAEAAKTRGEEFLAENGTKDGIVTTESGLQYRIDTAGEGDSPKETDTVKVHYAGRLLDGTTFDSSYDRGQPAEFPVNGVIKGWVEVLQLMKPGAKWEVWIPSEIAYGARGAGQNIGPNETLNFTIELLEIVSSE